MPSISMLPESHDVYVAWRGGEATISEIQSLRVLVSELSDRSLQELFKATRGSPRYFVGRMPYLRAIEIQRICRESGISVDLQ